MMKSPMFKFKWTKENKIVAIAIAICLVIVSSWIGYSTFYHPSQGKGTGGLYGTSFGVAFVNPGDGNITNNGGGWIVYINQVLYKFEWEKVSVQLTRWGLPNASLQVKGGQPNTVWNINGSKTPRWYALGAGNPMNYSHNGAAKVRVSTAMNGDDFLTLENAFFVVIDQDGNNRINLGDMVYVYRSNNGDTTPEIEGSGYSIQFNTNTQTICASPLT